MTVKKPLVIYLHGFLGHHNDANSLIQKHSSFDLVGISWSKLIQDNNCKTLVDLAITLNTLIENHYDKARYLYGYSMGGRLAMQLVGLYPEKWQGLILESAHIGFENGVQRRSQQIHWQETFQKLMSSDITTFLKQWYDQPLFHRSKQLLSQQEWKKKEGYSLEFIRDWALLFQTGNQIYFRETLRSWKNPILFLAGDEDSKYKELGLTLEKHIMAMKTVVVKQADHNVHVSNPVAVIAEINDFLKDA